MKKHLALLLCLMMILSLFACDTTDKNKDTENDTANTESLEKDDGTKDASISDINKQYYKIEEIELTKVRYYIYDSDGNVVLSDETDRPLDISMLGDNIVDICIGMGSGISIHKYYDVQSNRFSEEYTYVAATSGNLVAYIDTSMEYPMTNRVLVVRDIFDKNTFYKSFGLDFSPTVHDPIESASFTDGEAELEVVYLSERPPVSLSITIPIRRAAGEGEILSHAERAMQAYEAALKNEIRVCETDIEEWNYLKDCKTPYNRIPLCELERIGYIYIDIDGDSINELVIDCGDTLILRYYEGTVYVYPFTFRNMYQLNTDGSYNWNHTGQDFEYGENQLAFDIAKLKPKEIWRIVNDGEPNAEYYIDGKQVTQEEILKYIEDNPKTRIEFSPLEVSWLNKISRVGAVLLAQEYWSSFYTEDKGNIIVPGDNSLAPSHVYVVLMRRFVLDHWSTIDEIWIDKNTGEAIIPYVSAGKG
ncbi:MAG: hypothetical protein IJX94_02835 [Clostridia bacterium]|nr:hypothetical protein [Clostridia bacterium]